MSHNLGCIRDLAGLNVPLRCGYDRGFLERGEILKILYDNLPDDSKHSKLLVDKRIVDTVHKSDSITVHCTDGSKYSGDVLAGTDGIHSKVRSEMWRISNESIVQNGIPKSEQKPLTAVFGCLFGISRPIEGFTAADVEFTPDDGHALMWAVGTGGRIFWYIYHKLPAPTSRSSPVHRRGRRGLCSIDGRPAYHAQRDSPVSRFLGQSDYRDSSTHGDGRV